MAVLGIFLPLCAIVQENNKEERAVSDSPSTERRRFQRIAFDAPVQLISETQSWTATLIDISLRGALLKRPENWISPPQPPLFIRLCLDGETTVSLPVNLTHEEDQQLGFVCTQLDLDSVSLLRRLVELNLGEPELLNRELSALIQAD